MTAQEIIARIKAEVERRKGYISVTHFAEELLSILSDLEKELVTDFPTTDEEMKAFLDTHPKVEVPERYKKPDWVFEQPVCEWLEDEITNFTGEIITGVNPIYTEFTAKYIVDKTARHFAKWGAEHRGSSEIPKDLEEAAQKFADREYMVGDVDRSALYKGFWHGAKWQKEQDTREMIMSDSSYFQKCYELGKKDMKEQMMKEAVETEVTETCGIASVWFKTKQFKPGQKVRIIVIPNTEGK